MSDDSPPIGGDLRETLSEIQSYNESVEDIEDYELTDELDEQLKNALVSDPLYSRMIAELMKNRWAQQHLIEGLEPDQQEIFTKLYLNFSYMANENEVEWYLEKDNVSNVYKQVQQDFEDKSVSGELRDIFNENLKPILSEIDQYRENIRKDIFGEKYEQLRTIEQSDREDRDDIIDRLVEDHKNPNTKKEWEKIDILHTTAAFIMPFPYSESNTTTPLPNINDDENRFLKYCAIRICYPRLFTSLHTFEPEYNEYPLKWLPLGISRNRRAYTAFKNGNLNEELITSRVETDEFFDDMIATAEQIPAYRSRIDIVTEITENYDDGRYASVICVLLPQIEYLMWRYAAYLDARHDVEILIDADYDNFWNFSPRNNDNLKLRGVNGNIMEKPLIGDLVEKTALREYLSPDIAEYFGEEIFFDRNPILHGNTDNYNTKLEAAKKIVFFDHVCEQLVDTISRRFADEMEDSGVLDDLDIPRNYMAPRSDSE